MTLMKEYAFPLSCGWDLVPGWDPGAPDAALSLPALERAGSAFWALGAGLYFPSQFPAYALFRRSGKARRSSLRSCPL